MVNLDVAENVMELISLNIEKYHVKKVDASKDITVHMMEFVTHVIIALLIAQNVLIIEMKHILNSNALNVRVMILFLINMEDVTIALWIIARNVNLMKIEQKRFANNVRMDLV